MYVSWNSLGPSGCGEEEEGELEGISPEGGMKELR